MIDTHCHIIPKFEYNNPHETLDNAKLAGINKVICIGCDFLDIEQTLKLRSEFEEIVYASIGLHPEVVNEETNVGQIWKNFEKIFLQNKDKIFGIGECGLDYHYSESELIHEKQRDLFRKHIQLSIDYDKPLIIHTRDAWDDTFKIFDEFDIKNKKNTIHKIKDRGEFPDMDIILTSGILHSFTGGFEEAKKCIERGFKLGINGIVTFKTKNADSIRDAVKFVGKENIVFETDSPFLSPEPYRGKTNEPKRIKEIADYVINLLKS